MPSENPSYGFASPCKMCVKMTKKDTVTTVTTVTSYIVYTLFATSLKVIISFCLINIFFPKLNSCIYKGTSNEKLLNMKGIYSLDRMTKPERMSYQTKILRECNN